jgi:hypothetical protein
VLTKVRRIPTGDLEALSLAARCLRSPLRRARPAAYAVERIGVDGETVTFRDASGLSACDASRPIAADLWCGSSFGRLYRGHLRDPRLDIGSCTTRDGTSIAFAWFEPDPGVAYVAVAGNDYSEVYPVATKLPVRLSTRAIEPDNERATFHITEHDDRGRLVRRVELSPVPAG